MLRVLWPLSFMKRRGWSATLTVGSGETASDLTDYPLYVDLSHMPAAFWSSTNSGGDIRAFIGATQIPVDVVICTPGANTGAMFIKVPTLATASSTVITLRGNGSDAALAVGDTYGRNAVWADYESVMAFPDSSLVNRTGQSTTISVGGTLSYGVPMGMSPGGAVTFNAQADHIWETTLDSSNTFTMACSVRSNQYDSIENQAALSYNVAISSGNRQTLLYRGSAATHRFGIWDTTNGHLNGGSAPVDGTVYRLADVYNDTTHRKLYINGAEAANHNAPSAMSGTKTGFMIGTAVSASNEDWNGDIGFAYLRLSALSVDWLAAEYSNLNDPSSFYSIS